MSIPSSTATIGTSAPTPIRPATWQIFTGIALFQIGSALLLHRVVLADDIYQSLLLANGGGSGEDVLATARRWEVLSYITSPILLLLRVSLAALLVQLVLLSFRTTPPFERIFRAGIWAQGSLLLGAIVQTGWLASLPDGAIGIATLSAMPGSLGSLLAPLGTNPSPLLSLLHQTTIFDFGWIALFTVALEEKDKLPLGRAALSVLIAWGIIALVKWASLLYIMRLA